MASKENQESLNEIKKYLQALEHLQRLGINWYYFESLQQAIDDLERIKKENEQLRHILIDFDNTLFDNSELIGG